MGNQAIGYHVRQVMLSKRRVSTAIDPIDTESHTEELENERLATLHKNHSMMYSQMYAPRPVGRNIKFRPLTISVMAEKQPGLVLDAQTKNIRLHPDVCYVIWSTCTLGSFGTYYIASEGLDLNEVTLKVYKPNLCCTNQAWIEREILSQEIKPDCIPFFLRSFRYQFQNVLVLERMNPFTLQMRLKHCSRVEIRDATIYFCEMVLALAFLHSRNIIHRSMSLDSFWVQPNGHLKLTDYNRCVVGPTVHHVRAAKLSNYSAPETLRSRGSYTKMVDIWALGICLYRMISGLMPFRTESRRKMIYAIKYVKERYAAEFPLGLMFLCSKLLAKDPKQRIGYGEETLDAFRSYPLLERIDWLALFTSQFPQGRLLPPIQEGTNNEDNQLRVSMSLNLLDPSKPMKVKPFRFRDITTRSAGDLFNERGLLEKNWKNKYSRKGSFTYYKGQLSPF